MKVVRNTDSAIEPIKLQLVQDHLRIDSDSDQEILSEYIKAARQKFEDDTDYILTNQTYTIYLDSFPIGQEILLPIYPIQSIQSVKYYDTDGVLQTLSVSNYWTDLNDKHPRITATEDEYFPDTQLARVNSVEIALTAGHADPPTTVPSDIKQALYMLVGHYYENRQDAQVGIRVNAIPMGYRSIAERYKNFLGR